MRFILTRTLLASLLLASTACELDPKPIKDPQTSPSASPSVIPTSRPSVGPTPSATPTPSPTPTSAPTPLTEHVVVVSFDGGKPAAMLKSAMPNLMRTLAGGAGSWAARTVLPSATLTAHASMVSGVDTSVHKMTWDDWTPSKGLIPVPTMFSVARARGLRTALLAAKQKFRHYELPGSLDFSWIGSTGESDELIERAAAQILSLRPHLMLVHMPEGDDAGHEYGWDTKQQYANFAHADALLPKLFEASQLAGTWDRTLWIFTADHGGHKKTHGDDVDSDTIIPWIAYGPGVRAGITLPAGIKVYDTASTALFRLGVPVPAGWGAPVRGAFN